jgi:3'-5' exoribonuclease
MIRDFNLHETVTAFLAVRKKEVKEYEGKSFLSLEFGDASGRIAGVWWEPDRSAIEDLEEGMIVKVRGDIQLYRGKDQIRVQKMRPAKEDEYDLADLLPHSPVPLEELRRKVIDLTGKVENGFIRQ